MNYKSLLTVVLLAVSVKAVELNPSFLHSIHIVETNGKTGAIVGDHGKALGPFQIHRSYFEDAVKFDPSLGNNYKNVIDLSFSKRVVTAYLNRFAPKAVATNNFIVLARIHNGGPNGIKMSQTLKYWNKVKKTLTVNKN